MIWLFDIVSTSKYTIYSNLDAYTLGMMRTLYMKHFIILILLFIRISSSDLIILPVEWWLTRSLPSLTFDFRPECISALTILGSPTSILSLLSFSHEDQIYPETQVTTNVSPAGGRKNANQHKEFEETN